MGFFCSRKLQKHTLLIDRSRCGASMGLQATKRSSWPNRALSRQRTRWTSRRRSSSTHAGATWRASTRTCVAFTTFNYKVVTVQLSIFVSHSHQLSASYFCLSLFLQGAPPVIGMSESTTTSGDRVPKGDRVAEWRPWRGQGRQHALHPAVGALNMLLKY